MNLLNFSWVIDGKLAGHQAPSSEHDLEWLKKQGVLAFVRMAEEHMAKVDSHQIEQLGLLDYHMPVPDFTPPTLTQIGEMIQFIEVSLYERRPVGISCRAGMGRTGTILACYLVSKGYEADSAIDEIRTLRPGSIETKSQEDVVKAYAQLGG